MKILQANKFFFRNGGSESVMFQERDFLLGQGCEVVDFAMRDPRNLPSPYAEDFVAPRPYGPGAGPLARARAALGLIHSAEAVRRIGRLIDRTRPDLVHCHNVYHQLTPSICRAARRRGVPVVLTLHDYKPVCPVYTRLRAGRVCSECLDGGFHRVLVNRCAEGSLGRSALLLAEAWVQRLLGSYEQVDAFIAPSRFLRAAVTRRLPEDRVTVIPNGIDCATATPEPGDLGYALYLGRLAAEKGVETLLAAQAEVADLVPLHLAGTGPLEAVLGARYPRARLLGHLDGTALTEALRHAAVVVVPSEWYENCPMAVLEAMAWGRPVVASAIGGIPELVVPGETGLLFPPGDRAALRDALALLMADPGLRRRLGAAGRERAQRHFSLERHNQDLLRLYLGLVERAQAAAPRPGPARAPLATPQE